MHWRKNTISAWKMCIRDSRETYEKLMESNARYLGRMVVDENKEVGSKETDRETEDKQSEREEDVEKDERPEKPTITPTEKPEITVTPIIQNREEQKAKNADKQTEQEENLTEESPGDEEVTTAAAQVQPMPEIDLAPERLADYCLLYTSYSNYYSFHLPAEKICGRYGSRSSQGLMR